VRLSIRRLRRENKVRCNCKIRFLVRSSKLWNVAVCLLFCLQCLGHTLAAESDRRLNVVLISIDTLRADHVGAYGYAKHTTPNIDGIAKEGIVFERTYTPVPLTLPAHTSLLTGEYPFTHGVRDNGEALPDSVPTLSQHLKEFGFHTSAFVGAFVLDRRFGLARGFDDYWGEFRLYRYPGKDPGTIQIRGDRVEAAAEEWIAAHRSVPFFAFIHFYDLHGPYLLPTPWRSRFGGQIYDGELAFTDDLIGRLWTKLQSLSLIDHTILVITADHGEGLGDHGERHHGFFLYDSTTHVPLIFRLPGRHAAGLRVHSISRLIDIAPTICSLLKVPPLPTFEGQALAEQMEGTPVQQLVAYSETTYPEKYFHSSSLYSLHSRDYSFIQAPRPELYDIASDPKQIHNLVHESSAVAETLSAQLKKIVDTPARKATPRVDSSALKALQNLGYVGAATGQQANADHRLLSDPKDRIGLFNEFQNALSLVSEGNLEQAATQLDKICSSDPALVSVQIEAGIVRRELHQEDLALLHFQTAVQADPSNTLALFHLGVSLRNLHRDHEAEQELAQVSKLQPWFSQAYTARGLALARLGDLGLARTCFDQALKLDPEDFDALLNRGKIFTIVGDWNSADQDLQRALVLESNNSQAHQALGTLAFHRDQLKESLSEYMRAISLNPLDGSVHADLGLVHERLGKTKEAQTDFKRALELDPGNQEAADGLRRVH